MDTEEPAPRRQHRLGDAWAVIRASLSGAEYDHTRGPINRALILLAIPMVLEMAMESVFAIADMLFVARLGADAVAAVGLTEAVLTLLYAVAVGLGMSVTAMVARRVGEKRREDAAVAAGQALWIGLVLSVVIGLVGASYADSLLTLMGASAAVVETGSGYTRVLFGGSGTILFLFLINAAFRGAGDASIAMRALWLANGVNLLLDPLLIFGPGPFPELGVQGAAVATTIGRGTGVAYQLACLFGATGRIRLRARHLRATPSVMWRLLRLSIGGVSQFLIHTASWVVLVRIISISGSAAVAGYAIAIRLVDFTILPAWGLGNAASTLVGQNLGAGRPERAERSVWRACALNVTFLVTVGLVFITCAPSLLRIFSSEPDVVRHGVDALRIISYGYGLYAVGMIIVQAFNGAGDTYTPTTINFFVYWLMQIPLAWFLSQQAGLGARGVFHAILIGEGLLAVVAVLVFRRGRWKHRIV
jgi:putative MATE family efflux protein